MKFNSTILLSIFSLACHNAVASADEVQTECDPKRPGNCIQVDKDLYSLDDDGFVPVSFVNCPRTDYRVVIVKKGDPVNSTSRIWTQRVGTKNGVVNIPIAMFDFQIEGDYDIYLTGVNFGKKAGPIPVSIKPECIDLKDITLNPTNGSGFNRVYGTVDPLPMTGANGDTICDFKLNSACTSNGPFSAPTCKWEIHFTLNKAGSCNTNEASRRSGTIFVEGTGPEPYTITGGTFDFKGIEGKIDSVFNIQTAFLEDVTSVGKICYDTVKSIQTKCREDRLGNCIQVLKDIYTLGSDASIPVSFRNCARTDNRIVVVERGSEVSSTNALWSKKVGKTTGTIQIPLETTGFLLEGEFDVYLTGSSFGEKAGPLEVSILAPN